MYIGTNKKQLRSSSDPHSDTIFSHRFWHTIWKYIWHRHRDKYIYTCIYIYICHSNRHLFWHISGIYSDILSGSLSGIYSDIISGILSGTYSFYLAFSLASVRARVWPTAELVIWSSGPGVAHCIQSWAIGDRFGSRRGPLHHTWRCGSVHGAHCIRSWRYGVRAQAWVARRQEWRREGVSECVRGWVGEWVSRWVSCTLVQILIPSPGKCRKKG